MLRTLFFFLTFPFWTLLCILTALAASLRDARWSHAVGLLWARFSLWLAGVRVEVEGRKRIPDGPAIFMANHQSNFDILVLYPGLNRQFRWLAKAELFRIPLFGAAMRGSGYIPVEREDRRRALLSMKEAARRIAAGTSVIVFPEGTRSPGGKLLPFKKGGFQLALQAGVPIVPVALLGTRRVMPKGSLKIRGGTVQVRIFDPVAAGGAAPPDREELMAEVRKPIAEALERDRAD